MGIDVLILDDDADLRGPLAELLREEGFTVEELAEAGGLCDALARCQPSLVLLDLTLPGGNLKSAMAQIVARGLREGRTMMALSGLEDAPKLARELGLDGTIRKPFDIDELIGRIETVCRPDRSRQVERTSHPAQ